MPYQVTYTGYDGSLQTALVDQSTTGGAADVLGIEPERIQKIAVAQESFLQSLNARKPSLKKQRLVVTGLLVRLKSSRNGGDYLNEIADDPFFSSRAAAIRGALNISDKLRAMDFDPFLILLVAIGEKTNRLVVMTESAVADMVLRSELAKERKKKLIMPIMLGAMGLGYLLGIPLLMVPEIQKNLDTGYGVINTNALTDLAFWLSDLMYDKTILVMTVVAGFVGTLIWGTKNLPQAFPFSMFHDVICSRRAVDFAATYPALYAAGYTESDALEAIRPTLKGQSKIIYEDLLDHVREGKSLGSGFKPGDWTPLFMDVASSLNDVKPAETKGYFDEVMRDLIDDYATKSGKITTLVAIAAILMLAVSLSMLTIGLYFPMVTGR